MRTRELTSVANVVSSTCGFELPVQVSSSSSRSASATSSSSSATSSASTGSDNAAYTVGNTGLTGGQLAGTIVGSILGGLLVSPFGNASLAHDAHYLDSRITLPAIPFLPQKEKEGQPRSRISNPVNYTRNSFDRLWIQWSS